MVVCHFGEIVWEGIQWLTVYVVLYFLNISLHIVLLMTLYKVQVLLSHFP